LQEIANSIGISKSCAKELLESLKNELLDLASGNGRNEST